MSGANKSRDEVRVLFLRPRKTTVQRDWNIASNEHFGSNQKLDSNQNSNLSSFFLQTKLGNSMDRWKRKPYVFIGRLFVRVGFGCVVGHIKFQLSTVVQITFLQIFYVCSTWTELQPYNAYRTL